MARWTKTIGERFLDKTVVSDDCWTWIGATTTRGYGVMWMSGRLVGATTVAASLWTIEGSGPLILHSCDNRACVNPKHLRRGTARENTADMIARGRAPWMTMPELYRKLASDMRDKRKTSEPGS